MDLSEEQNGSVIAYLEEIGTGTDTYKIHIQGENGVYANPDSSFLFSEFQNLETIDGLKYFNTSKVTNMSFMFYMCYSLESLDLSDFDTSNVTNMAYMFSHYSGSQPLDLSSFNTTNVTDMSFMFYSYSSSQPLDLSNFNTSSVTDMSFMFDSWQGDASLDVSNFDFSKVISKISMFARKSAYYASPILVKDEAMKAWVLEQNPDLTGVTIKGV